MAEAVAALGLAANILQMLDYGGKILSTAWAIYDGTDATGFTSLQTLCEDLKSSVETLQKPQSEPDEAIAHLAKECSVVANALLQKLQALGLSKKMRIGKREALQAAFQRAWKRNEIQELENRLKQLKDQLLLRLVVSIRSNAAKTLDDQKNIIQGLTDALREKERLQMRLNGLLGRDDRGLGTEILRYLSLATGNHLDSRDNPHINYEVFRAWKAMGDSLPNRQLPILTSQTKNNKEKVLLNVLAYDGMHDRESGVVEAHERTFHWVFDEANTEQHTWDNLPGWLASDDQLYWITGKPGSGKSTLMKFISQPGNEDVEPRCVKHLRPWAKDQPLLVASFYFWASGDTKQTTVEALYRTLTHQILSAYPEAMPIASPDRWESLALFNMVEVFTGDTELRDVLFRAIHHVVRELGIRLCLFIDGLDEFQGDHKTLLDSLTHIIEAYPVKLCVSSRPWPVFEDAFHSRPSLRMEDLTFDDIQNFVTSRFLENKHFAVLEKLEPEFAGQLIDEIVRKSSGVFLWVRLVIESLLEGLLQADRISDLKHRLDQLPPDLEDLFDRILDSLDPVYLQHAAQYFSLVDCGAPSALLLYFADEDPTSSPLQLPCKDFTDQDINIRTDRIKRRINSRCKGFLEVVPSDSTHRGEHATVQYLHRTVFDYLKSPKVQAMLSAATSKDPFDPYLSLCSGSLSMCKTLSWERRFHHVLLCLQFAAQTALKNRSQMVAIVDNLRATLIDIKFTISFDVDLAEVYSRSGLPPTLPRNSLRWPDVVPANYPKTFLHLVLACGVAKYIQHKTILEDASFYRELEYFSPPTERLHKQILGKVRGLPDSFMGQKKSNQSTALAQSLMISALRLNHSNLACKPAIIEALLAKGADLNHVFAPNPGRPEEKTTVWIFTLAATLMVLHGEKNQEPNTELYRTYWGKIVAVMISHGARCDRGAVDKALDIFLRRRAKLDYKGADRRTLVDAAVKALRRTKETGEPFTIEEYYEFYSTEPAG
ncbi:hypothetical protein QBC47DRAFT_132305 [Echria macrotheca]|uniref:NACHT domain-containing protein n=1 Tax=Echria macrotheca TaxID=438768 RepID=A0AAJ0BJ07_9PEZI|nr:hypothetical protein QBC47DRAFT_132305 [Echria macrotheca]